MTLVTSLLLKLAIFTVVIGCIFASIRYFNIKEDELDTEFLQSVASKMDDAVKVLD